MKKYNVIVVSILWLTLQSCGALFTKMYGVKQPMAMSDTKVEKLANRLHIPTASSYIMDTTFTQLYLSLDSATSLAYKNHIQPLRIMYYNSAGELVSFHVNCYAGGFPNIDWEGNGVMNTFPPQSIAPLDSLFPLHRELQYIRPLTQSAPLHTIDSDFEVIVYWNRLMLRQSKRLIKVVKRNLALNTKYHIQTIYVNNDNFFWDLE